MNEVWNRCAPSCSASTWSRVGSSQMHKAVRTITTRGAHQERSSLAYYHTEAITMSLICCKTMLVPTIFDIHYYIATAARNLRLICISISSDNPGCGLIVKKPMTQLIGIYSRLVQDTALFINVERHRSWIEQSTYQLYKHACHFGQLTCSPLNISAELMNCTLN